MADTLFNVFFAVVVCYTVSYLTNRSKRPLPLPPGPPAEPFIGHLRSFRTSNPEIVFHEWSKKYGDVMHLTCMGSSTIVLGSQKAAIDLLESRGSLYSDRPRSVVYNLMGWDATISIMPYGPRFRKHRKLLHSHFTQKSCVQFQQIQLDNAHILVGGLMKNNGKHDQLMSRFAAAVVIRIAYGHQIRSDDDEYIRITHDMEAAMARGGMAGATPVDFFPILQYLPSWFPGTHFANVAREERSAISKFHNYPYQSVLKEMTEGTAESSFLSMQLDAAAGRPLTREEVDDLKGISGMIYNAGAGTMWTSLDSFLLAMILYPEYQKLGQEEVDRVVGRDRLPTFEDQDSLPYVKCVVQEILRWAPAAPLGLTHLSTHDDIYRFIPKGTHVFANILECHWTKAHTLTRQYSTHPDFYPSRRVVTENRLLRLCSALEEACPGRHLAIASMWAAVATIFSTLQISKAKDESGRDITPKAEYYTSITRNPKPFPCNITPRSEEASQLIAQALASTG